MVLRISQHPDPDCGVSFLRQLAVDLDRAKDGINASIDSARFVAESNKELGVYAVRAGDLLDEINSELARAIAPLEEMRSSLNCLADDLEAFIQSCRELP